MTQESKKWFIEKVAQNPEYLAMTYIPALERELAKSERAFREAVRSDDHLKMKYSLGFLDGMQKLYDAIDGLRISEKKTPGEPGLMARIFKGTIETVTETSP